MNREHDPSGKVQDRGHLARSIPSLNLLLTSTVWRQDRGRSILGGGGVRRDMPGCEPGGGALSAIDDLLSAVSRRWFQST